MNEFPFHSPTEQELPLETSWLDALAGSFTLNCVDFETDRDQRPTEIGLTRIHLGTGIIDKAYWTRLSGAYGCLQPFYPQIRGFLHEQIALAHNKATEQRCLFVGLIIPPPVKLWLDSLNIFRALLPLLRSYSLSDIISFLQIDVGTALEPTWPTARQLGPHNALWDSASTGLALHKLLAMAQNNHLSLQQLSQLMPRHAERPKTITHDTDWKS